MSTQVFPTLTGLGWDIIRTPIWDNIQQQNVSGKSVRVANYTYPLYQWDLIFNGLRQGVVNGATYTEFTQLMGFYNARKGSFDSFLYKDQDDNSVTGQALGTGNGTTTVFPLVRTLDGFIEPVFAPNVVSAVKLNGVTQSGGSYTILAWGTGNANGPGNIVFNTPPSAGVAVTADFTYYWPVRFLDDNLPFTKWISNMYDVKKLSLMSVKN